MSRVVYASGDLRISDYVPPGYGGSWLQFRVDGPENLHAQEVADLRDSLSEWLDRVGWER